MDRLNPAGLAHLALLAATVFRAGGAAGVRVGVEPDSGVVSSYRTSETRSMNFQPSPVRR